MHNSIQPNETDTVFLCSTVSRQCQQSRSGLLFLKKHLNILTTVAMMAKQHFISVALANLLTQQLGFDDEMKCLRWVTKLCINGETIGSKQLRNTATTYSEDLSLNTAHYYGPLNRRLLCGDMLPSPPEHHPNLLILQPKILFTFLLLKYWLHCSDGFLFLFFCPV